MNATVSWQAEPHFRGTYSILTSCLSTLFVSTWSALHLDIPESGKRGQSAFGRFLDKLGWLVLGLLAPEYLLLVAFNQFIAARELTEFAQWRLETPTEDPSLLVRSRGWIVTGLHHLRDFSERKSAHSVCDTEKRETQGTAAAVHKMDEVPKTAAEADSAMNAGPTIGAKNAESSVNIGSGPAGGSNREPGVESSTPPPWQRKYPWTITHSFFAIMGGFVLQNPHDTPVDRYLPAWQGNGVLTEHGVRALMRGEPDLIPDIPVDELLDRGKADGLAKMLLAWQVLWFCLSCLNRAVQHLPLSLLEVTTIAHALCALLTYAVWWKKPKDVGQPIVIGTHSDVPAVDRQRVRQVGAWLSTLSFANRSLLFDAILLFHPFEIKHLPGRYNIKLSEWPTSRFRDACDGKGPASPSDVRFLRSYLSVSAIRKWLTAQKVKYIFYGRPLPWYVDGSSINEAEEQAANERMRLLSSLSKDKVRDIARSPYKGSHPLVVPVAHVQAATHTAWTAKSRSGIGLALLPAVYGFPHLIGLGATFPTDVERSLWRWTTVAIMVLGVGTFVIVYVIMLIGECWSLTTEDDSAYGRFAAVVRDQISKAVAVFNVLVYFLGSMFLLVESFRQLFALPPDSFTLPSWGNYWPHFG
ncbi:hypothetical protein C8Q76DRAFT_800174 [Earliella scabrosa]|nr:hypothetical protein C8Q76DRAFT_800174 [Earliella scabrosa]